MTAIAKSALVVMVTAPSKKEAGRLANTLLKERLAACVNIVSGIHSRYWWKGKIESSSEILLLIKTTEKVFPKLSKRVQALHSYDVPEVLGIPVKRGSPSYLRWLNKCVKNR